MTPSPVPEDPADAGVAEQVPDQATAIEAARVLANQAKPHLDQAGFADDQVRKWAEAYISEQGSGDVSSFVAWIEAQERRAG